MGAIEGDTQRSATRQGQFSVKKASSSAVSVPCAIKFGNTPHQLFSDFNTEYLSGVTFLFFQEN